LNIIGTQKMIKNTILYLSIQLLENIQ